jgi:predicted NUDIX family phosphoesterase
MEDRYHGERILVFERCFLEELGTFQGTTRQVKKYLDKILDKKNNRFHLRVDAERDEDLKQIIPYVVFVCDDMVFSYVRGKQAGETRLVGNRSVGIGGHINPDDESLFAKADVSSDMQTYIRAVKREIAEEVYIEGNYDLDVVALINDDSNAVGRVHFGVVHVCRIPHKNIRKKESQITQSGFFSLANLRGKMNEELETWSRLAIELL